MGNKLGAPPPAGRGSTTPCCPWRTCVTATPYVWMAHPAGVDVSASCWGLPDRLRLRPAARPGDGRWTFVGERCSRTGSCRSCRCSSCSSAVGRSGCATSIIYELETDYANYLDALGAPDPAGAPVRLPQRPAAPGDRTRPAARGDHRRQRRDRGRVRLPGTGLPDLQAIQRQDFFLLQGVLPVRRDRRAASPTSSSTSPTSCSTRGRGPACRERQRDRAGHRSDGTEPPVVTAPAAARRRSCRGGPRGRHAKRCTSRCATEGDHRRHGDPRCSCSACSPRCSPTTRPASTSGRRPQPPSARVLVRHHDVRPGRLRHVRQRAAVDASSSACSAAGSPRCSA